MNAALVIRLAPQLITNRHRRKGQLLCQFSSQRCFPGFARINLATRKLPKPSVRLMHGSLAKQQSLSALDNSRNDCHQRGIHGTACALGS